jgi:type II secretory pathway pseudopilin PulG
MHNDNVILSEAKNLLFDNRKSRFFGLRAEVSPLGGRPQNDAQAGFTYLTVLFIVAFMGLGLAVTGEVWHTAVMRDREAELLYAGNQYRRAIERYYLSGPKQFPRALDDLLKDPRKPGTERYLRKPYNDPVTGKSEWGIVKAPDGGVMGVYSSSEDKPLKTAGFSIFNRDFEGAAKYSDWKFLYNPAGQQVPVQSLHQPPQSAAAK